MIRRAVLIVLLASLLAGCQAAAFVFGLRPPPNFDCIPNSVTRPCDYLSP